MAGIAMSASGPMMAYHGAKVSGVSTNPLAIAFPAKRRRPFVLDMSTSTVAMGKIMSARDAGREIPLGWGLDAAGRDTTDPRKVATLLPLGGAKGSGLSFMIECLCSIAINNPIIAPALAAGGELDAPYLNGIAAKCGLATSFYGEVHPSLGNYMALTTGSTQGLTTDPSPTSYQLSAPSIFTQLGSGWRALAEDMQSNCQHDTNGLYLARHNTPVYFTNLAAACQTQDVPLRDPPDLSARLTYITPSDCDVMHSCWSSPDDAQQVRNGDTWLSGLIPKLIQTPQYQAGNTAIFITWDEDDYHLDHDNHIATFVISPSTPAGARVATRFDHYSMLRTAEEMLGLRTDELGPNVAGAPSMRPGFNL
jgi:hypothetical protein